MLDDRIIELPDLHLQTAAHGVIQLEQMPREYGAERRRLRVLKMRGKDFTLGWHDFAIRRGGLEVYPRLVAAQYPGPGGLEKRLSSGIAELDTLLGGGFQMGTSTLIMGPAGTGKSSIAQQCAAAAARKGERAVIFNFDESLHTALRRAKALGMGLEEHMSSGLIRLDKVDPGQLSPGEFGNLVRKATESNGQTKATVLIIDSLNGYFNAMPEERSLLIQLHEMLSYLGQQGVMTLILLAQHGIVGPGTDTPVDTTYLADNAILLRFFEAAGQLKRAISVVKMRSSAHEDTIRELRIGREGIRVGDPLRQFQGVLSGEPKFIGRTEQMMRPLE